MPFLVIHYYYWSVFFIPFYLSWFGCISWICVFPAYFPASSWGALGVTLWFVGCRMWHGRNCSDLGPFDEVDFECSDIFQNSPFGNRAFDAVVSNPPYIPEQEKINMEHRVVECEPSLALFVPNNDPLLFYKRIIDLCERGMLNSGGWLAFECHTSFANDVADLFRVVNTKWGHVSLIEDLQGKPRHVFARIDLT